jgi:hypothetical protein
VPEVVAIEVVANHKKSISDLENEYNAVCTRAFHIVGKDNFNNCFIKDAIETRDYEKYFRERIVSVKGKFVPIPSTSHKQILDRYVSRKRPFHNGEKGYKDYLIWQNVIELACSSDEPVAFISANTHDFGKAVLHEDYLIDLKQAKVGASVELFESVKSFNEKHTTPALASLSALNAKFNDDTEEHFSLHAWVKENLFSYLKDLECAEAFSPLEPEHGRASLKELNSLQEIKACNVYLLADESYFIKASAKVDVRVSVSADWEDMRHDDVADFFSGEMFEWATADIDVGATVEYSLVLNKTFDVISADIDKIDSDYQEFTFS